ncbi:MAG: hypothetical protein ACRDNI_10930 [Gaiellaceae bacterium]
MVVTIVVVAAEVAAAVACFAAWIRPVAVETWAHGGRPDEAPLGEQGGVLGTTSGVALERAHEIERSLES